METTVKQRLVMYLKYKRIGQNRFEDMAGISHGYISNLKNSPGLTKLESILNAAPDLNRVWLLTGEGDMLAGSDVSLVQDTDEPKPYMENTHGVRFFRQGDGLMMEVPLVSYNALGSPEDEYTPLMSDRDGQETVMFPADKVYHGRYFSFIVDGDSMDNGSRDSFQRGDTVLVRELDRDDWMPKLHIKDWPYWVVCWGNCVRLKQIISQDGDEITLHSLNPSPEYTDFKLHLSDVFRLFNVIQVSPKPRIFRKK